MSWLVIIQHQVNGVELCADEDDLEGCVPERLRWVGPEEVEVAGHVYGQVEELGFEGNAGCALRANVSIEDKSCSIGKVPYAG